MKIKQKEKPNKFIIALWPTSFAFGCAYGWSDGENILGIISDGFISWGIAFLILLLYVAALASISEKSIEQIKREKELKKIRKIEKRMARKALKDEFRRAFFAGIGFGIGSSIFGGGNGNSGSGSSGG